MIATINCHTKMRIQEDWYNMSCLPKREKLDPKHASAIDFAVEKMTSHPVYKNNNSL